MFSMLSNESRDELVSVATDLAEVGLDLVLDEGVLRDIPLLGGIISLGKAVHSVPDAMFRAKLSRFLKNVSAHSTDAKAAWREEIESSHEKRQKVGETLLLTLDSCNDTRKAEYLAAVFLGYVAGSFDFKVFQALAHTIAVASALDLDEYCWSVGPIVVNDTGASGHVQLGSLYSLFTGGVIIATATIPGARPQARSTERGRYLFQVARKFMKSPS